MEDAGTLRYGPCEAESDGARVLVPVVAGAEGGIEVIFDPRRVPAVTATRGPGVSWTSDRKSLDVSEDESLMSSESDSDVSSDAVDGAYSCFRGEEDLRFFTLSDFAADLGSDMGEDSAMAGPPLIWRCGGGVGGASDCPFFDFSNAVGSDMRLADMTGGVGISSVKIRPLVEVEGLGRLSLECPLPDRAFH